jgi:hypothetical protein
LYIKFLRTIFIKIFPRAYNSVEKLILFGHPRNLQEQAAIKATKCGAILHNYIASRTDKQQKCFETKEKTVSIEGSKNRQREREQ